MEWINSTNHTFSSVTNRNLAIWQRNARRRKFGLLWENQPQWIWKSKAFCFGFPSSDSWILHSKELARWLGDLFSMSLRLPDSQGVVSICSRPLRGRRVVACFYVVENYQTNLHVTGLMPGEQTYWGRMLSVWKCYPGEGPAGQRGWHFFRSLSKWLSVGLLCLKRESWRFEESQILWLEARLHLYNVPLFVAQRRFFPPVPASPLLDISGGPGFAQWIHVFGGRWG